MTRSQLQLSNRQTQQITQHTRTLIVKAEHTIGHKLPKVEIYFDVHGSAWGYFSRRGTQRRIRYNPHLFLRYPQQGLDEVVPHEVAHFVVDGLYPNRRCKPHGPEWREIMGLFGIDHPRATHTTPLDNVPVRRQQRFSYQCDCGTVELSATRHHRVLRGARYICRRCGQTLRPTP